MEIKNKIILSVNYYKNIRSSSFIGPTEPIPVLIRKDTIGIFNDKESADEYLKTFQPVKVAEADLVSIQTGPFVMQVK